VSSGSRFNLPHTRGSRRFAPIALAQQRKAVCEFVDQFIDMCDDFISAAARSRAKTAGRLSHLKCRALPPTVFATS